MGKKKIEAIFTGLLVVVLAIVVFMHVKKKMHILSGAKSLITKMEPSFKTKSVKSTKANIDIVALQTQRAQLPWGRDPFFFTKIKKVYKSNTLVLKGISLGADGRGYAFINDKIVTVGEVINGYKVIEISKNKILLNKGGNNFYLGMAEE